MEIVDKQIHFLNTLFVKISKNHRNSKKSFISFWYSKFTMYNDKKKLKLNFSNKNKFFCQSSNFLNFRTKISGEDDKLLNKSAETQQELGENGNNQSFACFG